MTKANFTVCLYDDGLAGPLGKFVKAVWPVDTSAAAGLENAEQALSERAAPNRHKSPTFLFLKDEEVIGHIATRPAQLLCNAHLAPAHWVVGFMVLPEYRNGPIGPLLIKKVNETLELAMTLHVEQAALRIFKGLGWKHLGLIPQYVLILSAYRFFGNIRIGQMAFLRKYSVVCGSWLEHIVACKPARFLMASSFSLIRKARSLGLALLKPTVGPGHVIEEKELDPTYDALWTRVGSKFGALIVRDHAYLEARYGSRMKDYRLLACRYKGELLGYCILKMKRFHDDPRMGNVWMGTIVDCLFDPEDPRVLQSLLASAVQLCAREQVDAIFCAASHVEIQKLLFRNGFVRLPGSLHFAYHDRMGTVQENIDLASWHLMRGDSDADGNL